MTSLPVKISTFFLNSLPAIPTNATPTVCVIGPCDVLVESVEALGAYESVLEDVGAGAGVTESVAVGIDESVAGRAVLS